MVTRVLLADDNSLFRAGFNALLARCEGVEVVGLAGGAAEAVEKTMLLKPDVALIDLHMPDGSSVEAIRQIRHSRPHQAICVLTVSGEDPSLIDAIRVGARGHIVKAVDLDDLRRANQVLAKGGSVISPFLAAQLLDAFREVPERLRAGLEAPRALNGREKQLLQLVAGGASEAEVARQLTTPEYRVKADLRRILDRFQQRDDGGGPAGAGVPAWPLRPLGHLSAEAPLLDDDSVSFADR